MKAARLFAAVIAGSSFAGVASSQTYPVKPVRVVVPFPPGGANDITARVVLPKLSEQMGQTFVIDNRSGAGGTTGSAIVAKSPGDGYTLLIQTIGSHVSNAHLYSKLPYDALRDFTAVSPFGRLVAVLTVHPSMPPRTVKELIALAKSRPKQVLLGHAGYGSFIHLNAVIFEAMTRVQVTQVPFKGGGPAVVGLISGETQAMLAGIGDIIEHIKAGRARPLGVTSTERIGLLPNVPTIAETVPGFECTTWIMMLAPAGTPKGIVDQLNSEIGKALSDASVASRLISVTYDPVHKTAEELAQKLKADYELVGKLFRQFNVKLD
jgi:tripartite-type tricarboxylate transporter receptor subunit TctC